MSVVIGLKLFTPEVGAIVVYDEQLDNVDCRKLLRGSFQGFISNLKYEFKEKLRKIYVLPHDNVPDDTNDEKIYLLSAKDLDFTNHLSAKPALGTRILHFYHLHGQSTVRCTSYDLTTMDRNVLSAKPVKYADIHFDEGIFYETLMEVFDGNLNEFHAILRESETVNGIFFEKIKLEKGRFCSFTVSAHESSTPAYKSMIYGRFLLHEEKVQCLVKLESYTVLNESRLKDFDLEIKEYFQLPGPVNTYKSQTKLMGIDLGESRCVVCISRNNSAQLVKIDQEYSMPTIISFAEEKPIIGTVAMRHLKNYTKSVLYDFKFCLKSLPFQRSQMWAFDVCETSKDVLFVLDSAGKRKIYSSIEIHQILLQKLKQAASEYQSITNGDAPVDQVVITVPHFNHRNMIENIRAAASLTALKIIDIITETHADLLYFLSKYDISPGQSIVIVDIGGGTGFIQKFNVDGDSKKKVTSRYKFDFISGREIDHWLMTQLLDLIGKKIGDLSDTEKSKILIEAERIKELLSFDETTYVNFPSTITTGNPPQVTRTWFEQKVLNNQYFAHSGLKKILLRSMYDVRFFPRPSKVFLVGGTCRIPYIQNYFKSIFGKDKIVVPTDIQHITATGALIRGLQVLNGETKPVFHETTLSDRTIDV